MAPKLTKPQRAALKAIFDAGGTFTCADSYQPVRKLLALGLVVTKEWRFSTSYCITETGRRALEED